MHLQANYFFVCRSTLDCEKPFTRHLPSRCDAKHFAVDASKENRQRSWTYSVDRALYGALVRFFSSPRFRLWQTHSWHFFFLLPARIDFCNAAHWRCSVGCLRLVRPSPRRPRRLNVCRARRWPPPNQNDSQRWTQKHPRYTMHQGKI